MTLGETIRLYRKKKNMTQEEMGVRLGVSAPAVNKWEKGVSMPDITLLAPLARLLDITLDTLLAFRENLTGEEIRQFVLQADQQLKEKPYEEAFLWMKEKIEEYPNCEELILQFAMIMEAQRILQELSMEDNWTEYIISLYQRVLESQKEELRISAAMSLSNLYLRRKEYEKAESYLDYLSVQNPERKRRQAVIYSETNRIQDAYRAHEELLFSYYQMASASMNGIYHLALQENDLEKAHAMAESQAELARCFQMGRYYEVSCQLELAALEKEVDKTLFIMEEMLAHTEDLGNFRGASLYEHMEFKELDPDFAEEMKENLRKCFQDETTFGYLHNNKGWKKLLFGY